MYNETGIYKCGICGCILQVIKVPAPIVFGTYKILIEDKKCSNVYHGEGKTTTFGYDSNRHRNLILLENDNLKLIRILFG